MSAYVYILTNQRHTVFYTGVTTTLKKRIWQHKNKQIKGFTSKYNIGKLVYFEKYELIYVAIAREKVVKKYKRTWKHRLINKLNPKWVDLYDNL